MATHSCVAGMGVFKGIKGPPNLRRKLTLSNQYLHKLCLKTAPLLHCIPQKAKQPGKVQLGGTVNLIWIFFFFLKKGSSQGWKDDLVVKSTGFSSRKPKFGSLHSHGGSQPSVTPVLALFWPRRTQGPRMVHRYIWRQNTHNTWKT